MQPLFVQWPTHAVHAQYGPPTTTAAPYDEFMFGNALLVRPVMSHDTQVKVHLPAGKWRSFIKPMALITSDGIQTTTITYEMKTDTGLPTDYPVFLKEKEILMIGDAAQPTTLSAYVFFESNGTSVDYVLHRPDLNGAVQSVVILRAWRDSTGVWIGRTVDGMVVESVSMTPDAYGKGFSIAPIASLMD
jgi:alpha-glucosidase (family GH31 glycosyl hydrolase)